MLKFANMKKLTILVMLLLPCLIFSQSRSFKNSGIDNYKYFVVESTTYKNSKKIILKELKKSGYNVLDVNSAFPDELENNPDLALYVNSQESCGYSNCEATFQLLTNNGGVFYTRGWQGAISSGIALKQAMKPMLQYNHKYVPASNNTSNQGDSSNMFNSEDDFRKYFDDNGVELIEGIWEYSSTTSGDNTYKLAIVKDGYKYKALIVEGSGLWKIGDEKAVMETAASEEILTIKWTMGDKRTVNKTVGTVKNNALIEFQLAGETVLYKVYPKFDSKPSNKTNKSGEWAGNGSGIIISKSGHIVTNYHVIEDTEDIEVEFIVDSEIQKFNAEIIQVDKTNDLAIIKIFDMNFDGVDNLPYNFKTRSSDVGTKVYAFGYPMALSVMGKEIKITDGIISSKSGYDGDITTYQITAPIQGGNSGGPLFDEKGNFIGINSSGLGADVANNVGYTIKSSYVLNLIDVLPKSIDLPSSTKLESLPLTEQIKEISKYVVLIKVK